MPKGFAIINEAAGLQTQPNELTLPPGSLSVAENVEITRDGIIEVARGFKDFSDNLPDFTPEQILVVGGVAYLNLDSGLWYHDGTRWLRKRGALGAKSTQPLGCVVLNGVLFYLANKCVLAIDLSSGDRFVVAGRFDTAGVVDSTGDAARFTDAQDITTDGTNLFIAEGARATIRRVAPPLTAGAGIVTTIAGTDNTAGSADGVGAAARFSSVNGIAWDGTSLYVIDGGNNRTIRKLNPPLTAGAAVVTTIAGTAGVTGSNDGTGEAAQFGALGGIACDGTNLFIADKGNKVVRKAEPPLTAGAAIVTTIAGTAGVTGSVDGTGAAAQFGVDLENLVSDGTNLFLCDPNGNETIRKIAPPLTAGAAVVTTIAGTAGVAGSVDGIGTAAKFHAPFGIDHADGDLYVCDYGNGLIRKIYATGYVATISGIAGATAAAFGFDHADGIVAGPSE